MTKNNTKFSDEEARWIGDQLGLDWRKYDFEQFKTGLETELEHGSINPVTNITDDDIMMTAKIALAHLNEIPDYYTRLKNMEAQAYAELKSKK